MSFLYVLGFFFKLKDSVNVSLSVSLSFFVFSNGDGGVRLRAAGGCT